MTSYEVVPEPCFDIFRLPRELPGEIMSRDYLIVKPSNQVVASLFGTNSLYEFQLSNPAQMMDLNESYILMSLALCDVAASPLAPIKGNAGFLDTIAIAFAPALFRQVQLTIGTTVISSSSTNAGISQYVYNLLRWSKSAALSGDLDVLEYLDVVAGEGATATRPQSNSVYPPGSTSATSIGDYGAQKTNVFTTTPSQVLTITAGTPFPVYGTANTTGATPANLTFGINPEFNYGFYKRSLKIAYATGASLNATFNLRIPLNRLFGFCKEGMPVIYGQPVNLRFYPSKSSQYIQKTAARNGNAYDFYIQSMDLFLNVKKPSAAVAARIQEALAAGAKTRYQYNDFDTFQFTGNGQTFTITLGVPSYYLTWLALSFRPSSYFADQTAAAPTPNVGCSVCPNPIANDDCPFSQAYITYGQQIIPAIPYGTSKADLGRMYNTYQECCDTLNPAGQGAIIDYEQWCQNHFIVVFDLRNRDITGITGASPATSLTINLQFNQTPLVSSAGGAANAPYQVSATWFACREVEFQATSQGVAIVSV